MGRRRSTVVSSHHASVTLVQSVRNAIHQGSSLFNEGKQQQCYKIYLATAYSGLAQEAMRGHNQHESGKIETMGIQHDNFSDMESTYIGDLLMAAIQEASAQAKKKGEYTKSAWVLRRAFDKILVLSSKTHAATTVAAVKDSVEKLAVSKTGDEKKQGDVDGSLEEAQQKATRLANLCNSMQKILEIGDHRFHLKTYSDTFVGDAAVTKLVETGLCISRPDAITKLNDMIHYGLLHHATKEHSFKDEPLFYKLTSTMDLRSALNNLGNKVNQLQGDALVHYATLLGRYKNEHKHPSLGVLRLDYDYPPAPGDIDHPDSYEYPVYYRVVPGLTFQMCQEGKMTPEVGAAFDEAVLWLANHKDVSVITGDCGFMFWFVERVRKIASKNIISLSPLMQLPIMVAACAPRDKILVLTANGTSLDPMQDLIKRQCGVDGQNTQFIFVGCENVEYFGCEVEKGLEVDVAKAEPGIVALALEMVKAHPDTRMILFECTELPPYSDAVREATRLPVMDAITNCDFFMAGFLDNKAFGLNGWYEEWDGIQEEYVLGQNLDDGQKLQCVWCRNNELNPTH